MGELSSLRISEQFALWDTRSPRVVEMSLSINNERACPGGRPGIQSCHGAGGFWR
jgi:hypothetical protein